MTGAQDILRFQRPARTRRNVIIVGAVVAGLVLARLGLDAAWPFIVLGALLVAPAAWDIAAGRVAELVLHPEALTWRTAGQTGEVRYADITKVSLDTRLDLSVRMTLFLRGGARLKLPPECTPPKADAAAALEARGLTVEQSAFALI